MRIVSICPSNTEILWFLGLGDQVVGLDRSSDWPPELHRLPRVGPDLSVDVEKIQGLKADIVLSSSSVPGMEKNLADLDAAGVPHVVVDARDMEGVFGSIQLVGRLFGVAPRADALVSELRRRLDVVQAKSRRFPRRAQVYLEWWPKPLITPGAECWTNQMIAIAGGENVFGQLPGRSAPIEAADVIRKGPDVILTCWCGVPHQNQRPGKVPEREGWARVPAVVTGHIFAADEAFFGRPGPRVVEGVEWLHEHLAGWAQFEEDSCTSFEVSA
jgi:iron complex transport system substrate-binding protein